MNLKNLIKAAIPRQAVWFAEYLLRIPVDIYDRLVGNHDPMIPPTRLMFDGPRGFRVFKENGREFFKYFVDVGGLSPTDRVLDVGSGIGRKCLPLIEYLKPPGGYEGFDINRTGVRWCVNRITSKHPNFRFTLVDVRNDLYNPRGRTAVRDFRFPYEANTFDFVIVSSVFTHMLTDEMEHYVGEIRRVLKPGGRCFVTFFLLNSESVPLMGTAQSTLNFRHPLKGCRTINPVTPEVAVAYDESFVLSVLEQHGLKLEREIHYGSWCGRQRFTSYQDMIVASKTAQSSAKQSHAVSSL